MYNYTDKNMDRIYGSFVWNKAKELTNIHKHRVNFFTAVKVFKDAQRKIFIDEKHSKTEKRFFCIGKINNKILTVRFVYQRGKIRIFGAGYWRKGLKYYEEKKS